VFYPTNNKENTMNHTQDVKTTQEGAWFNISQVDVPDYARKHQPEGVDSLSVDMGQNGQLQNIVLVKKADGRYECIIGNGRLEAAKKLGWEKIRADVKEGLTESQKLMMMIAENDKREDFNPFDRALAYQRVVSTGITQRELAEGLGTTEQNVSAILSWLQFSPEVTENLRRLKFSGAHLKELARLPDAESQLKIADSCDKQGWSSKVLRDKVSRALAGGDAEKVAQAPAEPPAPFQFAWKKGDLIIKGCFQPTVKNPPEYLGQFGAALVQYLEQNPNPQATEVTQKAA
jgi:ParB/RepB/Spo0J family partition protein